MAALVITASNVVANAASAQANAGEAITAGQALFLDSADNKVRLADASDPAKATVLGIATNSAAANQPVSYVGANGVILTIGTGGQGKGVVLGPTPGTLHDDINDLLATHIVSQIGVINDSQGIVMSINNSGIAVV